MTTILFWVALFFIIRTSLKLHSTVFSCHFGGTYFANAGITTSNDGNFTREIRNVRKLEMLCPPHLRLLFLCMCNKLLVEKGKRGTDNYVRETEFL